jgi:hypothetical protein
MANPTKVIIDGDASGVVKAAGIAQGALGKLQVQMGALEAASAKGLSFSGLAGIGLSATAAAAGLFAITKSAADYGDQLDNMSQRTGVAVEDLAKLQFAAKMSDTTNEALGKGLAVLSNLMVGAAGGAEESSKLFERYGIAVRNADGSVRSTIDVLGDLADVFTTLPDGAEKTALATEFFGKKIGVELIPLLNQGKDGLKALGDEAERLGLVISADQAKAAAEFNDNLDRMAALASSLGKTIGNELIPVMNKFLGQIFDASNNKLSFWQMLGLGTDAPGADPVEKLKKASADLAKLKAEMAAAQKQNLSDGGSIDTSGIEKQIAAQEKLVGYYKDQAKRLEVEQGLSDGKRATMATNLAAKQKELEQLRAIAAGKASGDILKSDKELNDARIKDAERLRDALRTAYEASKNDAVKAAEESKKLFEQARKVRTSAADKAAEMGMEGMSPEEKAAAAGQQAQSMLDQGRYYAAAAGAAKLDGRLAQMEKYQQQASEYLDRAQAFAEKSGDAGMVQGIAEQQAKALEAQAKAKQAEAADLEQRAAAQMANLTAVEAKLTELNTKAAAFEINADITKLVGEIETLKKQIGEGAVMPIKMVPQQGEAAPAPASSGASGSFAGGGWTGWGGKYEPAGIVHRQEYVTPSQITAQRGVIPFLEALRKYGNKVLPGYSAGGLVGNLSLPSLASASGSAPGADSKTPLVLDFGKLGRINAEASRDSADEILRVFDRARMQFGRRP